MKDKVIFKVGEFIDFNNIPRQVVFCAISCEYDGIVDSWSVADSDTINKRVLLGIAVQNVNDEPNLELGKVIAQGKARNYKSRIGVLYSSNKGLINRRVVEALLEQELEHFKQAPQVYIKGYAKALEKFNKAK